VDHIWMYLSCFQMSAKQVSDDSMNITGEVMKNVNGCVVFVKKVLNQIPPHWPFPTNLISYYMFLLLRQFLKS